MPRKKTDIQEKEENKASIEENFARLEDIIKKLEAGDSTLEESFTCYEAGMKLVKSLSGQIDNVEAVIPFMAAVEMIHTSSLVHDDLPCMDDDMMRRGKASTWAEYGEDIGVLTGDALMMFAFETAANAFETSIDPDELSRIGRAMGILAHKTGVYGMIGGQTVDVELAGGPIPGDKLDFIYRLKTGALIEASMLIGAVLGGAAEEDCKIVESLASKIGMAFQIQDDILDVTGSQDVTGKPSGSDEKNKKTTYVTLEGLEKAKKDVEQISTEAIEELNKLPGNNEFLEHLIRALVGRQK